MVFFDVQASGRQGGLRYFGSGWAGLEKLVCQRKFVAAADEESPQHLRKHPLR